jgi:hypothetical protein
VILGSFSVTYFPVYFGWFSHVETAKDGFCFEFGAHITPRLPNGKHILESGGWEEHPADSLGEIGNLSRDLE